jgi:hypothetical protein
MMEVDWQTLLADSWIQFSLLLALVALASYLLGLSELSTGARVRLIILIPSLAAAATLVLIPGLPREWLNLVIQYGASWLLHAFLMSLFIEWGRRAKKRRIPKHLAFLRKL